ncbi:MAG: glycine betaine/L-proline ABC transporter ATP-binding protein [Roseovarius sp.]
MSVGGVEVGKSPAAETPAADTRAAITCRHLWKVFGEHARPRLEKARAEPVGDSAAVAEALAAQGLVPAVRDVSFDVSRGELFVVMGLSGSGKSTLVRCISNLVQGTSGEILIDGENVLGMGRKRLIELRRHKIGMVFQHFGLFPHMTVLENVAFPLKMQGKTARARKERAAEVIELVGLSGREGAYPRELSGGQRQRVGLARSLSVNPDIWFLDEPFSALDPLIRRQLQDEFLKLQAGLAKTIVFITHDIAEALKLADRIAIMKDGEIVQIGTPTEIVLNPANAYVAEFSRDVPKGRHAHLRHLMHTGRPFPAEMPDDPGLTTEMTVEAALAQCLRRRENAPVWNAARSEIVGYVHPGDLAAALDAAPDSGTTDRGGS